MKAKLDEMKKAEAAEREAAYARIAEQYGAGVADALRAQYALYDERFYLWLADLYNPGEYDEDGNPLGGGFYYSNSARDTEGYLIDIESTAQTLTFLVSSGMMRGYDNDYINVSLNGISHCYVDDVNFCAVNYRKTSADYREFGERTPQDQYILTSGVGSNMSAAIPPTIDEEVSDYEDAVNNAFGEAISEKIEIEENTTSGDDAVEDWLAEEGNTLKGLLSDWCERSGWRLVWNSNRNYTLGAGAMFRGRFADVTSALIRTFARAQPAPMATFYKGNRVLVVETREDENAFN